MLFPDLTTLIIKSLVIMMLFSLINMKLRDFYPSLDSLCKDLDLNKEEIISRLKDAGFEYNEELNKFW